MSRTFQCIIVIIAYKLTVVTVFLKIFSKCIPISKMCQNIINTFSEERCFMKKVFLIPAAVLAAVVIIASARICANGEKAVSSGISSAEVLSGEDREPMYIVKTYEGKVAVFRQYDSKPMYLAEDLPLDSLPKYDKAMLDAGIKIYSDEDLRKLLEDYDS